MRVFLALGLTIAQELGLTIVRVEEVAEIGPTSDDPNVDTNGSGPVGESDER